METSTLFALASLAGVAVVIMIGQAQRISTLRRERDLFLTTQSHQGGVSGGLHHPLFSHAPFPILLIGSNDEIIWSNPSFSKLASNKDVGTLSQLDKLWGSKLEALPRHVTAAHHAHLSLRYPGKEVHHRRLFTVLTWPYQEGRRKGTVMCLVEQTAVQYRTLQRSGFEQQLVHYIDGLASHLRQVAEHVTGNARHELNYVVSEADAISDLLHTLHEALRRPSAHHPTELPTICKEVMSALRSELRSQHIHVTHILPHSAPVIADREELRMALVLVFESLLELCRPGSNLRIELSKHNRQTELVLTMPQLTLQRGQSKSIFNFVSGSHAKNRYTQLKLALAQQLLLKYHANLALSSEEGQGTIIKLIFSANIHTAE